MGGRKNLRGAVRRAGREGRRPYPRIVHGRGAGQGRAPHRQEGRRGGRRVLDGRRARGPRTGGGGDIPVALPGPGADAGAEPEAGGCVPPPMTLRIAVPNKGTLAGPAAQMLREAGYRQRSDDRDLICRDPDNDVEFFYLRPRDIATYVGSGDLDLGVTGRDLLIDAEAGAEEGLDLGFGGATFRFAALPGTFDGAFDLAGRRIATAYPGVVARYLAEQAVAAEVVKLDGAVENAIRLGVADVIADVVSTGATLRQAGLETVGKPLLES